MSDYLTREFRAQLNTSMDSVLRRAVFEIMLIFENSLHDHRRDLAKKGEEIARLKIKLERAEIKLTESELGGAKMNETQRAPGHTAENPDIDVEEPDDWCAPLGSETVIKQEYNACPSVRLRKLTIPLWPIPVIKQEVVDDDVDQQTQPLERTGRGSSLREWHRRRKEGTLTMRDQETHQPPLRKNMEKLLQDIKQEYTDLSVSTDPKKRERKKKKVQENTTNSCCEEIRITATESTEKKNVKKEKRYTCKVCSKVFDTEVGRSVHVRFHKRCQGCKKDFPFPSALNFHKQGCEKLKTLLEKEGANPPELESCDEEKPTTPTKKQVTIQRKSVPPSSNHSERSIQKDGPIRKNVCEQCDKSFPKPWLLKQHFRIHTGERPYPCNMCPKRFRVNQHLRKHKLRIHKDQMNSSETNGNLSLTKPLEKTEDNREAVTSPRKDKRPPINHKDVQKSSQTWQTMGTHCSDGFCCSLCQKVLSTKYQLIEHFRIHTGDKPIKCLRCPAVFRFRGQLSMHKKRCHKHNKADLIVSQCVKCKKKFSSQERCKWHMSHCHRDQPISCNICGKCFFLKGRLMNHMERFHN